MRNILSLLVLFFSFPSFAESPCERVAQDERKLSALQGRAESLDYQLLKKMDVPIVYQFRNGDHVERCVEARSVLQNMKMTEYIKQQPSRDKNINTEYKFYKSGGYDVIEICRQEKPIKPADESPDGFNLKTP